jgi:hypothetical protein
MRAIAFVSLLTVGFASYAAPVDHCGLITGTETTLPITGNTVASFGNDYDVNVCQGTPGSPWLPQSGASTEQVFAVRVQDNCTMTVVTQGLASGANQADPAVYATTSCPAQTASTLLMDSTCLASIDQTGGLGTETMSFAALRNRTYYLFIDGFLAAEGPYSTNITGCTLIEAAIFFDSFE